jgi:signal transduction histidine kinase
MSTAVAAWVLAAAGLAAALGQWRARAAGLLGVRRACHELRGPITAARLGLQLGAATGELSASRLRALDLELGRAGLALEELSRAGAAGTERVRATEHVDLAALVRDSVSAWHACARLHGATLSAAWEGGPAAVRGERLRLAQVTGNLIANAIEHGGREVAVRGAVLGGRARIEVRDDGPGLPAHVRERLLGERPRGRLARIRRVESARGPWHGHGLAIAHAIVREHGGSLTAEAPSGELTTYGMPGCAPGAIAGACLVVELPLAG